jgi:hypothetical protein
MGFRSPELLRVYFFTKTEEAAKSIKIIEKKNKHTTIRYIPQSLINLILRSKANYPLSA